jgi:hypothetical protein
MKITIEPTEFPPRGGIYTPAVSISVPDDDLSMTKVIEYLIRPALLATFDSEIVDKYFPNPS